MKNFLIYIVLVLISACNGGGGGGGSSSSSLGCSPTITVGGENYDAEKCKLNQELPGYCSFQSQSCKNACRDEYNRRRANGVRGGVLESFLSSCNSSCFNSIELPCLERNAYPSYVCEQPSTIANPDCQSPPPVDQSSGGSNSSNSDTCFGQGYWTNIGCPGYCQSNPSANGCSGSGIVGATTGGTTTGGTTTGGTTTGGTTTGGTTTGGTTVQDIGAWRSLAVSPQSPSGRYSHKAIWTGTEMIVWGGVESYGLNGRTTNSGGRFNPVTNSWTMLAQSSGTPNPRDYSSVIWTGAEMIVWGGSFSNTGSAYDPATNSWNPTSITGAPSPRHHHSAIWTGNRMIIWGGADNSGSGYNDGGIYNPLTFSWSLISGSLANSPSARRGHSAVWTGSEMIIWGGNEIGASVVNTGARYNPVTCIWNSISTISAPSSRMDHSSIWTGSEMIVWGGASGGGLYKPSTNTWRAISTINAPTGGTPVWTGTKMIVWGRNSTGGIFDPVSNSWSSINLSDEPSMRWDHSAIWAGTELIIWGGIDNSNGDFKNSGGIFKP